MRPALQLIVAILVTVAFAKPVAASPGPGILEGDEIVPPEDATVAQRARAEKTGALVARRLRVPKHQSLFLLDTYVLEDQLFARYGLRYRGVPVAQSYVLVKLPADDKVEISEHEHVPLPASLHIDVRPEVTAGAARKAVLALAGRADGKPTLEIRLLVTTELGDPGEGRSYWTSDDVAEIATGYQLLYRMATPHGRYTVDAHTGIAKRERKPRKRSHPRRR